jgi:hypothetical protein
LHHQSQSQAKAREIAKGMEAEIDELLKEDASRAVALQRR